MRIQTVLMVGLVSIAATILTACAPKQSQGEAANKIIVWHWMNDRHTAFQALAARYTQETGTQIEFKLISPPDIYSQKVIAAARAGNLPEVFGILGEKSILASFVKAGYIADITPYMNADGQSWKNSFYQQALAVNAFIENNRHAVPAGIYGVPIDMTIMGFVYNKDLMAKAGLSPDVPPATLTDLIAYAKVVKEKTGVNGFVCGWGEGWLLNALAVEWAINEMGEEKFVNTLKGDVPYTDPQWIKVFSLFTRLKDSGILGPNITTMINKEAEDSFSKESAVFSFNGSWAINVYKQLNPNLNYAFFSLPRISDDNPVKLWGGAGSSFMVNAASSKKEKAVDFLKWFTAPQQQQFLVAETNNLPSIKGCESTFTPILASIAGEMNSLTHPNIWPYNEDSRVLEVMNQGLQQITMGVKKAEEVAEEIQQVKMRVNAK